MSKTAISPSSLPLTSMPRCRGWKATCVTSWQWVSSNEVTGRCSGSGVPQVWVQVRGGVEGRALWARWAQQQSVQMTQIRQRVRRSRGAFWQQQAGATAAPAAGPEAAGVSSGRLKRRHAGSNLIMQAPAN